MSRVIQQQGRGVCIGCRSNVTIEVKMLDVIEWVTYKVIMPFDAIVSLNRVFINLFNNFFNLARSS